MRNLIIENWRSGKQNNNSNNENWNIKNVKICDSETLKLHVKVWLVASKNDNVKHWKTQELNKYKKETNCENINNLLK